MDPTQKMTTNKQTDNLTQSLSFKVKRENTRVRNNVTLAKTLALSLRGAVLVCSEWSLCRCCPGGVGGRRKGEGQSISVSKSKRVLLFCSLTQAVC